MKSQLEWPSFYLFCLWKRRRKIEFSFFSLLVHDIFSLKKKTKFIRDFRWIWLRTMWLKVRVCDTCTQGPICSIFRPCSIQLSLSCTTDEHRRRTRQLEEEKEKKNEIIELFSARPNPIGWSFCCCERIFKIFWSAKFYVRIPEFTDFECNIFQNDIFIYVRLALLLSCSIWAHARLKLINTKTINMKNMLKYNKIIMCST